MSGSQGGSISTSKQKSTSQSEAGTQYPWEFQQGLNQNIGRPFTIQEVAGLLPYTQSVFGGNAPQIVPYNAGPPTGTTTRSSAPGDAMASLGFQAASPGGGGAAPGGGGIFGSGLDFSNPYIARAATQAIMGQTRGAPTGGTAQPGPNPAYPAGGPTDTNVPRYQLGDLLQNMTDVAQGGRGADEKVILGQHPEWKQGFTLDDLVKAYNAGNPAYQRALGPAIQALYAQDQVRRAMNQPRLATQPGPAGGDVFQAGMGGDLAQAMRNLGFGQAPTSITPQTVGAAPTITAPQVNYDINAPGASTANVFGRYETPVTAATDAAKLQAQRAMQSGNFSIGQQQAALNAARAKDRFATEQSGAKGYENAVYKSIADPQLRELQRQQMMTNDALKRQLAQTGLAESGTGMGQQLRLARDYQQRMSDVSAQAAAQATAQRFDRQAQQEFFNAGQQETAAARAQQAATQNQQLRLQNAGMNMQAQQQNAANVLQGNLANASNYLSAMGLNVQQAQQARESFLAALGVRQQDLSRMTGQQMQSLQLLLNTWLQEAGVLADAGRTSAASSYGKSNSFGISEYSSGSFGGGGGGGGGSTAAAAM